MKTLTMPLIGTVGMPFAKGNRSYSPDISPQRSPPLLISPDTKIAAQGEAASSGLRKKESTNMKYALRVILGVAFAFSVAFAQEPTGSIEGTVTDPQTAVVQNASVTVRNTATNFSRTTTSADNGTYRVTQLPPGTYEVKVSGTNFQDVGGFRRRCCGRADSAARHPS